MNKVTLAAAGLLIKQFRPLCRAPAELRLPPVTEVSHSKAERLLERGWAVARNEDRKPAVKKEAQLRQGTRKQTAQDRKLPSGPSK